jgi:isocitrate/isopropylmalate dehydrogenase
MLLTTAMMLDWLSETQRDKNCATGAKLIRNAVNRAFEANVKTPDLGGKQRTAQVKDFVIRHIRDMRPS